MGKRGRRTMRRGAVAACLVALGLLIPTTGVASASSPVGAVADITFWNNDNVVTLNVPSLCPTGNPNCVWMLWVNEPDIPAQTVVGRATGTSGVLTVAYPADFCGVIQADVLVGPAPWRLMFGHQASIQTGACDCPVAPAASSVGSGSGQTRSGRHATIRRSPAGGPARARRSLAGDDAPTRRSTARGPGTSQRSPVDGQATTPAAICNPTTAITDEVNTVPANTVPPSTSQVQFTSTASTVSAPDATLPFTGMDFRPLVIAGSSLVLVGLGLVTTFEQRRRALTRTGRWFLGE
jgi:hypothetical protein